MRRNNDFYPTPPSVLEAIFRNWRLPYFGAIWEPCCGDGRIVDALAARGRTVLRGDIVTGQDFFAVDRAPVRTLFTNPPFKHIRPFIDHAFSIGVRRMVLVCPERLFACEKGRQQFRRHRPTRWANMSWREDYQGKGGQADRALAVAIWERPHSRGCTYEVWERPGE